MSKERLSSESKILTLTELELAGGGSRNAKYQAILDAPNDMDNANAIIKKFCNDDGNAAMFISQHFGLDIKFVNAAMKNERNRTNN
ncbi:MAG: hypothetical protein WCP79_08285 [Bacillota bacterium]